MNVFKIVINDIKQGIIKNKRFLFVPFLTLFASMIADTRIRICRTGYNLTQKGSFMDVFEEVFHGGDPFSKLESFQVQYMWLSIFICLLLITFDYMYNDISQFGIQVLTRTRHRSKWWFSKCIYNITSSIIYYALLLATMLLFAKIHGYDISLHNTKEITYSLMDSGVYTLKTDIELSKKEIMLHLLSPLVLLTALNMMQMTLSLIIKPAYSFIAVMGIAVFGLFFDNKLAFSRMGMLMMSESFYKNGFKLKDPFIICGAIIIASIISGCIIFKRYNILPGKE